MNVLNPGREGLSLLIKLGDEVTHGLVAKDNA